MSNSPHKVQGFADLNGLGWVSQRAEAQTHPLGQADRRRAAAERTMDGTVLYNDRS
jgi:hypothetical protein